MKQFTLLFSQIVYCLECVCFGSFSGVLREQNGNKDPQSIPKSVEAEKVEDEKKGRMIKQKKTVSK